MSELPKIVGLEYLVPITGKSLATLRTDASTRPDCLPPRFRLPGTKRVMFVMEDVHDWVNSFRPVKPEIKRKRGRPALSQLVGQSGS